MGESKEPQGANGLETAGKKDREESRKITYRVGWRSGTIHLKDRPKPPSGGSLEAYAVKPLPVKSFGRTGTARRRPPSSSPAAALDRLAKALLSPAPLPGERAWRLALAALPAVAFAAAAWLSYMLSAGGG